MIIIRFIKSFFKTIWQLMMKFFRLHKKIYAPKNFFHYDNALALLSIFIFLLLLRNVNFEILNPLGDAFADVALNDVVFSGMDKNSEYREKVNGIQEYDTNIVLVNIGHLNRLQLGQLIGSVSRFEPKVIGLDILFDKDLDPNPIIQPGMSKDSSALISTLVLSDYLNACPNIVYGRQGYIPDSIEFDGYYDSLDYTTPYVMNGLNNRVPALVNLYQPPESREGMAVCRKFMPGAFIKKDSVYMDHFTSAMLKIYMPEKYDQLKKRGNILEYINYTGNIFPQELTYMMPQEVFKQKFPYPRFLAYDVNTFFEETDEDFLEELHRKIKGKIVILGYLNSELASKDKVHYDDFFTPLNPQYVGKATKDMYGAVVHANALAMMIHENYIDEMPNWLGELIGLIVTYIVFASYRPIYNDYKNWYDGLTKFLGIAMSIILLIIIGLVFDVWDYEINFSAFYFAIILLAGDWLEVYYGFIKTFAIRVKNNM